MQLNKRLFITFFALLFSFGGIAQDNEKQPLQKILKELEQRYNVTFTFIDKNVEGIFIIPPAKEKDLTETLLYLRQQTSLLFQSLNERYVTISKVERVSLEICGTISYSDTAEKVAGATIQCGKELSISDETGFFKLKNISENDVVKIRFVGYQTIVVPVKEFLSAPCKKITLLPELTTLQEVFVSDFITKGIDKKLDGSLVITAETLGILPGLIEPDVLQTIQVLPGIQSINETVSDINVRGGTNDQNLMLWDGIRMYHSGHFFGLISAFNPYLTEKITLTKNGSSSVLGDGVSSTIDIRTDDQVAEIFSAGAGVNMINGDMFAKIPLSKKTSLQVSARRSLADILQTPTYKQYFDRVFRDTDVTNSATTDTLLGKNEKFYFYDTSLKLLYNMSEKDKLRVSFLNVFNTIEYQENRLINTISESRTSELAQHNLGSGISYSRLWNEKVRTSAQLYLSAYNLGAINFDLLNDQRLIQKNKVLDTGLKLDARVSLTNAIDIYTGYQFTEVGVTNLEDINNPPFSRLIKKVIRSHSTFLEGNFAFHQSNMRLGVRSNYFPGFEKLILEPRFSFNQKFLDYWNFELLGEMKSQSITQIIDLQSDFLGVEKRRWVLSNNEDIPIIRSKQVSTGIVYKKVDFLISVEGYYKHVSGIITSAQGFQNQFQFVRSNGSYKTIGVDFLASKKFDPVAIWVSYSNANSTFEFQQLLPPSFPNSLDIRHRATFGASYGVKNFEISTGLNWHSGKPYTEPLKPNEIVNNKINYNAPNSSRLADYLRVDFSAKYRFTINDKVKAQFGVSIWNILNRQNVINRYFSITDNNQLESGQQSSLGRTPNLIFRVNF